MQILRRIPWPKFSLTGLFWFATAVTLGFAISKTSSVERDMTPFGLSERSSYTPTLISIGSVLVVYELVRQAILLWRSPWDGQLAKSTLGFAVSLRCALAIGIAFALVYTQLINRQFIVPEESDEIFRYSVKVWPSTALPLMLFASMRMMTKCTYGTPSSQFMRIVAAIIVWFGLALILVYLVTDRNAVTFLVHVGISGVEKYQAMRWQRVDAFPDHVAEGFYTFQVSLRAVSAIGIGGLCLVIASRTTNKATKLPLGLVFAVTVAHGIHHAYWFVTHEFPRINPDLASQKFAGLNCEKMGATLLLIGLSFVLGDRLARLSRSETSLSSYSGIALPNASGLMVIAALLVAIGCGSVFVRTCFSLLWAPSTWFTTGSMWLERLACFVSLLAYSEEIIAIAVAIAGLRIVWQYYRPPEEPTHLQPRNARRVLTYSAAVLLWLVAAVPTFAIFGFCYWLGPWVL